MTMGLLSRVAIFAAMTALVVVSAHSAAAQEHRVAESVSRVDRVADGDTISLANGQRARRCRSTRRRCNFGVECYGRATHPTATHPHPTLRPGRRIRIKGAASGRNALGALFERAELVPFSPDLAQLHKSPSNGHADRERNAVEHVLRPGGGA